MPRRKEVGGRVAGQIPLHYEDCACSCGRNRAKSRRTRSIRTVTRNWSIYTRKTKAFTGPLHWKLIQSGAIVKGTRGRKGGYAQRRGCLTCTQHELSAKISATSVYGCQGNPGAHCGQGNLSCVHQRRAFTDPGRPASLPLNELKHLGNWIPRRCGNVDTTIAFNSLLSVMLFRRFVSSKCRVEFCFTKTTWNH